MKKQIGQIISTKTPKTCVVSLVELRQHSLYNKLFKKTTHFLVHDEKAEYKVGDIVEIIPTRPISKQKAWKVARKIQ